MNPKTLLSTEGDLAISRYVDALMGVFTMTANLVASTQYITVRATDVGKYVANGAPAFSLGDKVFISKAHLRNKLSMARSKSPGYTMKDYFMETRGLFFHELCHVMFTPSQRSEFIKQVESARDQDYLNSSLYMMGLNQLEDQRIEMLFTSKYTPSSPYFRASYAQNILRNLEPSTYILTVGRFYLSKALRRDIRKLFVSQFGETLAQEVDQIVKEYVTLTYPADTLRGVALLKRWVSVLRALQDNHPVGEGCGHGGPSPKGEPGDYRGANAKEERELSETVKERVKQDEESSDGDDDDADEAEGDGSSTTGDSDADGSESTDSDQESETNDTGDSEGGDANPPETGDGNEVAGAASGVEKPDFQDHKDSISIEDITQRVFDELDEIMEDVKVQQDLNDLADAVLSEASKQSEISGESWPSTEVQASQHANMLRSRLKTQLSRLKVDLEPTWHHRQASGKANVRRVMVREPHQLNVFDKWDAGSEDTASTEVVIILDCSGSMSFRMDAASEIAWSLNAALTENEIPTTVLGFSSDWAVLHGPGDKPSRTKVPMYAAQSSTVPGQVTAAARDRLLTSPANNRIALIITDGSWSGADNAERNIAAMNRHGVQTGILGLASAVSSYGLHECQFGRDIEDVEDVVGVVDEMVSKILRNARRR